MEDEHDQYQYEKPRYMEVQAVRQRRQARLRKAVIAVGALGIAAVLIDLVLEEGFDCYLLFRSRDAWEMLIYTNRDSEGVESAVYHTGHVKREDAERLGTYLIKSSVFAGPSTITVVLSRSEAGYVVSFFVREKQFDDPILIAKLQDHRKNISAEAFGGEPVIIQMCERSVWPAGSHPMMKVVRELRD